MNNLNSVISQNQQSQFPQFKNHHIQEQYFMLLKLFKLIQSNQYDKNQQNKAYTNYIHENLLNNYHLFGNKNSKHFKSCQKQWVYELFNQLSDTPNQEIDNFEQKVEQFLNFLMEQQGQSQDQENYVKRQEMIDETCQINISIGKLFKFYDQLPSHPFLCVNLQQITKTDNLAQNQSEIFVLIVKNIMGQILFLSIFKDQDKIEALIHFCKVIKKRSFLLIMDEIQNQNQRINKKILQGLRQRADFIYIFIDKKPKLSIFSQNIQEPQNSETYYQNLLIHFKELQNDDQKIFQNKNITQMYLIKQIVKLNYSKLKISRQKEFQLFVKDQIQKLQVLKKHNQEYVSQHFLQKQDRSKKCKQCPRKSIFRCIGCSIEQQTSVSLCVLCMKVYHDNLDKQREKRLIQKQQKRKRANQLKSKNRQKYYGTMIKQQQNSPEYNLSSRFPFEVKVPQTLLLKMNTYFYKFQQMSKKLSLQSSQVENQSINKEQLLSFKRNLSNLSQSLIQSGLQILKISQQIDKNLLQ